MPADPALPPPPAVRVEGRYSNYFRIGYNAFEFLVDFGQAYADDDSAGEVHTRIVIMPSYAKALAALLTTSLREYESSFGPIPDAPDEEENP